MTQAATEQILTTREPFLETYPVPERYGKPLNPGGALQYVIILSHCHYDHIGGIEQFLEGGNTEIIASAAGRDFIESDLAAHSLCKHMNIPTPSFKVTHWAQSNERLTWPLRKSLPGDNAALQVDRDQPADLGIIVLHTPGHTPDSLCWFDYDERTLYVGDTLYMLGSELEPIYIPPQGDLVEWFHSLEKITTFILRNQLPGVHGELLVSASHTTCNADAWPFVRSAMALQGPLIQGEPLGSLIRYDEIFDYYIAPDSEGSPYRMAILLPRRLVHFARAYYGFASRRSSVRSRGSPSLAQ
ncbi:hypothetical protein AMS68_005004 [Peltaster fructicola]|uniref:Metallo-beta-lactamase domain-containing protein n=1 Tax=Peltaster fructicola TaxID=286661 RepID=A0A6H0XXI4_9PEZI|nr:hypothetical protein AMS68_005004 [Peltaster fructicola]